MVLGLAMAACGCSFDTCCCTTASSSASAGCVSASNCRLCCSGGSGAGVNCGVDNGGSSGTMTPGTSKLDLRRRHGVACSSGRLTAGVTAAMPSASPAPAACGWAGWCSLGSAAGAVCCFCCAACVTAVGPPCPLLRAPMPSVVAASSLSVCTAGRCTGTAAGRLQPVVDIISSNTSTLPLDAPLPFVPRGVRGGPAAVLARFGLRQLLSGGSCWGCCIAFSGCRCNWWATLCAAGGRCVYAAPAAACDVVAAADAGAAQLSLGSWRGR